MDWNQYTELSYAQAMRDKLVSIGFDQNLGMLIDTSATAGAAPTGPADQARRPAMSTTWTVGATTAIHLGNWCNQSGAGLGERPQASPAAGIDAYVWMKPPRRVRRRERRSRTTGENSTGCATPRTRATRAAAANPSGAWATPRCPGTGSPRSSRS
ncbi:glycoside hydrolase family 6 protein [Streptomyces thinghirensis]|nr:glycoside hydrolase family 6 protein [Streptomyces thinghirensis]